MLGGYFALLVVLLYLPIFILVLFSLNQNTVLIFPLEGFTLDWYQKALDTPEAIHAARNSLIVALGSSVVAVGAIIADKPMIVATVTDDLVARGMHAGNLVGAAAKLMGGGGGGRPTMAQAGGKESGKLGEALAAVEAWVRANLKG